MSEMLRELASIVERGEKTKGMAYEHDRFALWQDTASDALTFLLDNRAAIEQAVRDAERYRWLRDIAWSLPAVAQEELPAVAVFSGSGRRCKDISGEEMDQAIDAAMAQESGND